MNKQQKKDKIIVTVCWIAFIILCIWTILILLNYEENSRKTIDKEYKIIHNKNIQQENAIYSIERVKKIQDVVEKRNKTTILMENELHKQEEMQRKVEEIEKKKQQEEQQKQKQSEYPTNQQYKDLGIFNVSFYSIYCKGCSGITALGIDVRNTVTYQGYGIAASDWSVIPPYSIIEVEKYGKYIVIDRGGAIKGLKLDLLVENDTVAYQNGRQYLNVKIIRWGKGD